MRHLALAAALAAPAALAPAAAHACGGLFCNTAQPINQAAERILFGHDGERMHMHVRITYQGPPTEFGWLLPAAPDVEISQSSEQLFTQLDRQFAPQFRLQTEIDPDCELAFAGGGLDAGAFADAAPQEPAPPGVQVLSREAVGPFDVATLLPDTIDDLRAWLDDNGYQIPADTDATLQPYLANGLVFVAVKLLPDRDSGEISPLRLSYTAATPSIPIVPTSVAANPDMGIIVHVLGEHRAVPTNYSHVVINETAIDWSTGGQNYPDVVSQAADEADGRAFATDYAGASGDAPAPYDALTLALVREADHGDDLLEALDLFFGPVDADLLRVMPAGVHLPDGLTIQEYLGCPSCYDGQGVEIDGGALVDAIEQQINVPRRALAELFERNPYLTRLYSTLSPAEMVLDPAFGENPDLGDVPNVRTATQRVSCDDDGFPDFGNAIIETPSGLRFRLVDGQNPNSIRRQDGETVRGDGVPGAQMIERPLTAGPNEVIDDRTPQIEDGNRGALGDGGGAGCACDAGDGGPASTLALLGLLAALGLRRRR